MTGAVWTLIASVLATALASAAVLYLKLRRDRLRAQLRLIDEQLRSFYGPLLANAEAGERAWQAFVRRYNPQAGRNFWSLQYPPSHEAIIAWHHWVTTVFMPINDQMVDVVSRRSDLVIAENVRDGASAMPDCLADLCGHVHALRAELGSWSGVPKDAYFPSVPYYPADELLGYLRYSFGRLKAEQVRLLRATVANSKYPIVESWEPPLLIADQERSPGKAEAQVNAGRSIGSQFGPQTAGPDRLSPPPTGD